MEMARAKRNVAVLVVAQALLGSQMPMIFIIGGLAGLMLSPNPCFATLPISLIILGSTTTAPWLSPFMYRHGRRAGFWIGCLGGMAGAAISLVAIAQGNFWLLLIGSYATGIYMSAQGFYRFAATDTAPSDFKPKAISYVLAGGLLSALIGPQLVKATSDLMIFPFMGSYAMIMLLNLVGMPLFFALDVPKPAPATHDSVPVRSKSELLADPRIRVAIICGLVSYALMNLVMTSTPLAVVGCGFDQNTASDIVSAHVLAMYIPSFFTGHLIARYGARPIIAIGLVIMASAGLVALSGVEISSFYITLILLGIGWNFGFIGATSMLSKSYQPHEQGRVQGLNDAIIFGGVTLASLASGGLLNCSGGSVQEGWNMVNLAMMPLLMLAGISLIWLRFQRR